MALSDSVIKDTNELVKWWNWHHSMLENASVEHQNRFLLQFCNSMLRAYVNLVEDIHDSGDQPQIVLPKGVALHDNVRA